MAKIIIESILFMFGLADNPVKPRKQRSDEECIADDWNAVGRDLMEAMGRYNIKTSNEILCHRSL